MFIYSKPVVFNIIIFLAYFSVVQSCILIDDQMLSVGNGFTAQWPQLF